MDAREYRLGVDFGTSNTVAMLAWPDGHVRPLLFDGSPTLPSAVYADPQSGLLVGRDAMHAARISPERYEPNPKRRIDEPVVLLGDREVATVDLIASVLARVAGEARRVTGGLLGPVTVTCPAAWAHTRRGVLQAAAERAGLGAVTLVPEPVAAAQVFLTLSGSEAPSSLPGSSFVVYDLGAGTFDASVVRHGGGTFEVLAAEGLSTSGGLDIDAAIVGYLGAAHAAGNPDAWRRLTHPGTSAERRAHRLLWDDVRASKEMLSRTAATMIHLPALETDVPLGRDQFEQLARPILTATVTATRAAIAASGVGVAGIDGVFLVGGGSRIPLVATLLHQALGKAPTVVEQPELVVAQGAVGASLQFTLPQSTGSAAPPAPGFAATTAPTYTSGAYTAGTYAGGGQTAGMAPPSYGPAPVSGPPGMPISAVPSSGGGSPAAPVSPAFASMPVTGYPAPPPTGVPPTGPANPPGPAVPPPGPGPVPGVQIGAAAMPPPGAAPTTATGSGKGRRAGLLVAAIVVVVAVIGLGVWGVTKLGGGGSGDSGDDGSSVTAEVVHDSVDWTTTAADYDGHAGTTVAYDCPSDGAIGTVWGTGTYTTDSSVCTAAVHDGRITLKDGGRVIIKIMEGQDSYEGSTQHDIVTTGYDAYPWAFQIVG
ncbi:Hsp70 family protein [Dactylosporangium sp. CA-092794]|uniref:Hsp70 family protein n=1 Tax=Dactylosporangium sp. CA-092794 TaxID=3239929 RepID=UPI003D8B39DD